MADRDRRGLGVLRRRLAEAGGSLLLLAAVPLSAAPVNMVWNGLLPRMPEAGEQIVISQVAGAEGARHAALRRRADDGAAPAALPIDRPLLPAAFALPFGVEERCAVRKEAGEWRIECRAGVKPAGVRIGLGDQHWPRGAVLNLAVRSDGASGFAMAIRRGEGDVAAPHPLRPPASIFAVPPGDNNETVSLNLIAPATGGRVALEDVRLVARTVPTDDAAAWAWDAGAWTARPERLIADAKRRGLRRLFIALPIEAGSVRNPGSLRVFLRRAHAAGIGVDAVEGDPDMVEGEGLAAAVVRARAIAAFQAAAPPGERLSGVQYDVEPYIRPGWRDRDGSYLSWADSIRTLAGAAGTAVDLVVPFWLAGTERGRAMLDRAAPAVRMVTAMAYRTDPAAIERIAEPMLAWGARRGTPVRIALEAGRLDDEIETRFVQAPRGTLALFPGDPPRVTLLEVADTVPGATMFAAAGRTEIRAAALSFQGDEAAMIRDAAGLRSVFGAWPEFAGFVFHGVAWSPAASSPK